VSIKSVTSPNYLWLHRYIISDIIVRLKERTPIKRALWLAVGVVSLHFRLAIWLGSLPLRPGRLAVGVEFFLLCPGRLAVGVEFFLFCPGRLAVGVESLFFLSRKRPCGRTMVSSTCFEPLTHSVTPMQMYWNSALTALYKQCTHCTV